MQVSMQVSMQVKTTLRVLSIGSVLTLLGCSGAGSVDPNGNSSEGSNEAARRTSVRFIAIGDVGTGVSDEDADHKQLAVAKLMKQVCDLRGCDFVSVAGDNIYEAGVTAKDDPQFDDKFEQPYADLDLPFVMALGNHDNSGSALGLGEGARNGRGDFQVDYHHDCDDIAGCSGKFYMPSRFYSVAFPVGAEEPILELFVLDSSSITHFKRDDSDWYSEGYEAYMLAQRSWLQDGLASSTAQWTLGMAHHPYVSNGSHGNAGNYERGQGSTDTCALMALAQLDVAQLIAPGQYVASACYGEEYKQFLDDTICSQAFNVDLFLQGHDHDLQWLQAVQGREIDGLSYDCGDTQFILSGAGAKKRSFASTDRNHSVFQADDTWGFFWLELHKNGRMDVSVFTLNENGTAASRIDVDGNPIPLYTKATYQDGAVR